MKSLKLNIYLYICPVESYLIPKCPTKIFTAPNQKPPNHIGQDSTPCAFLVRSFIFMQMRDSTIFYRSFYESIKDLPRENQLNLYNAIFEFMFLEKEPSFVGIEKTLWTLIRPNLKANNKKYKDGLKGGEHGVKGGRPRKNKITPVGLIKITPNEDEDVNEDENVNVNEDKNEDKKDKKFIPPTYKEVWEYFYANGYLESAAKKAFEYYDTAKWVDSRGNKVRNWKQKMISVWFKDENKKEERGFVC